MKENVVKKDKCVIISESEYKSLLSIKNDYLTLDDSFNYIKNEYDNLLSEIQKSKKELKITFDVNLNISNGLIRKSFGGSDIKSPILELKYNNDGIELDSITAEIIQSGDCSIEGEAKEKLNPILNILIQKISDLANNAWKKQVDEYNDKIKKLQFENSNLKFEINIHNSSNFIDRLKKIEIEK